MATLIRRDDDIQTDVIEELQWDPRVQAIAGVKGVTNLLIAKPHPLPADLKQSIERALVRNAQTDAKNISIEVHGSKVILRGTVRSYAEKRAAEDTIWSAPGVSEVENQIAIRPIL